MSRKTISIPVEGDREYVDRVKRAAGANGLTIAFVVRQAIDAHLFFATDGNKKFHQETKDTTDETR